MAWEAKRAMDAQPSGTNGFDRDLTERLLRDIDAADAQLASLKGEYMANCKGPRGDIAEVFKEAKDKGLPVRAFRAIVKNRRLDRQMSSNVDRLENDDQASYDALVVGLGDFCDLPLGQAALRRARPAAEESLNSLAAS
jgi:GapR-like, DNA-binding domain